MKQGIILYQSKYGATQKYANWLSDKTGFDCIAVDKADMKQIQQYDVIVLGGAIYASGISGLSFLKNIWKHYGENDWLYSVSVLHLMIKKQWNKYISIT